jgi:hypothetical protein
MAQVDKQATLLQMHNHRSARDELQKGLIERFVPVTDEHYAGILEMLVQVERAWHRLRMPGSSSSNNMHGIVRR